MPYKKTVTGAHIELDINVGWYTESKLKHGDTDGYIKDLRNVARDVLDFLRDHRSLDVHGVSVVEEYDFMCSHCHWVSEKDDLRPECCEAAIREWASDEQLKEFGY